MNKKQEESKQEILPEFKLSKDIFNKLSCLSSKDLPQEFSKLIDENFDELFSEGPKQDCTCGVCNECEEQETIQILNEAKESALKQSTLEEAAARYSQGWEEIHPTLYPEDMTPIAVSKIDFIAGAKWMEERMFSEEDMRKSFFQGWVTRERFDDQIPDIIYPQGLDYEKKQEYAFNLWFEKFKKK